MTDEIESIITKSLNELSTLRPIFHSERDFQHELSTILKLMFKSELNKEVHLLLERPFRNNNNKTINCDIVILDGSYFYPIELKYKTKKLNYTSHFPNGAVEEFDLSNQGAQTQYRYKILIDLERIEDIVLHNCNCPIGFSITLTNDPTYYENIANYFSLHEGAIIEKELPLPIDPNNGTYGKSMHNIVLNNAYLIKWKPYSIIEERNGTFKYNIFTTVRADYSNE